MVFTDNLSKFPFSKLDTQCVLQVTDKYLILQSMSQTAQQIRFLQVSGNNFDYVEKFKNV